MKFDKRGMSHVEIVLGAVLFIGIVLFVIFLLIEDKTKTYMDDKEFLKIENFLKTEVSQFSLLNSSSNVVQVNISEYGENCSATNSGGNVLEKDRQGDILKVKSNGDKFVSIVCGQGIEKNYTSVEGEAKQDYKRGLLYKESIVSQTKVEYINKSYEESKKEMEIGNLNFRLKIDNRTGEIFEVGANIPDDKEVYRKSINAEFLFKDGRKGFVNEEIYVW